MDLRLPNIGDIVTCRYFNALCPDKAWMCYDIDYSTRVCEFRTFTANRTTSARRVEFYELDAMISEGILKVIYPANGPAEFAEKT